ncbi:HAD family hydrolase [Lactococcus kimchii]|uniref:HAD family hydrolase n=1 Tax=Lactococcus sp. S-13 TaxID=2507158 RepID=UPI001022CAF3|nr:HAD family hydrolase [Lactococcus sp. S-13]RZI49625.1 HAD family hydrolase [Lactococcus sp. S-13]
MTKIKYIFSDLDGTLLNTEGKISEQSQKIIKNCQIPFTLVSARTPQAMEEFIEQLDLTSPQIAFNGGLIFDKTHTIAENTLARSTVKHLVQIIKKNYPKLSLSFYTRENWYVEQLDEPIKEEMRFTPQQPKIVNFTKQLEKKSATKIFKILLIFPDEEQLEQTKLTLEALHLPDIIIQKTWESYLEITSKKAQKAFAIKTIAKINHLKKEELAAFGDNENDLSMLQAVGCPIAMENASNKIKKLAKLITKKNDEDGVAYGIEKYIVD